jgi:hypothetical protein
MMKFLRESSRTAIILGEPAKHFNKDTKKEESVSELMQLMSWWKLAETTCVMSVLPDLPQDSNIDTNLNTGVSSMIKEMRNLKGVHGVCLSDIIMEIES